MLWDCGFRERYSGYSRFLLLAEFYGLCFWYSFRSSSSCHRNANGHLKCYSVFERCVCDNFHTNFKNRRNHEKSNLLHPSINRIELSNQTPSPSRPVAIGASLGASSGSTLVLCLAFLFYREYKRRIELENVIIDASHGRVSLELE